MYLNKFIIVSLFCCSLNSYAGFKDGGEAYLRGDFEAAAAEFIPLAERGDHRAMYALGSMYSAGHGVKKNLKKAFSLFSEAAQNGRADAMYKLGLMYEEGLSVKPNHKKAVRFYQKSAKKGYPLGQYKFGLMYEQGIGVKQNPINAYAWLTVAGHYFIYEVIGFDSENFSANKLQYSLFLHQEKDKVLNNIINKLQALRKNLNTDDIEKIRARVIKFSKYRKNHSANTQGVKVDAKIENLFLPETLY